LHASQKIAKSIPKVGVAASGAGSKSALTVASNQAGFLTKKRGRERGRRRRSRSQQQMQKRTKSTSMQWCYYLVQQRWATRCHLGEIFDAFFILVTCISAPERLFIWCRKFFI